MSKCIVQCCFFVSILCIYIAVLLTGCSQKPDSTIPTANSSTVISNNIDFSFVVIGETSVADIYAVAPSVYATKKTPEGFLFEYSKLDGRYIHITFQRETLIVSAIEEVSESIKSSNTQKKYYTLEDFQSIIVDKSTIWDVYLVAPDTSFYAVSYGTYCEYPTEDGGAIGMQFHGPEMVVKSIEIIHGKKTGQGDGSVVPSEQTE